MDGRCSSGISRVPSKMLTLDEGLGLGLGLGARARAPKLGVKTDQEVCDFNDLYIRCDIPEDDEILVVVSKVQKHRHSATCRRNKSC